MIEWLRYMLTGMTKAQREALMKAQRNAIQEEEHKEALQRIRRIPDALRAAAVHGGKSNPGTFEQSMRVFELAAEAVRLVEEVGVDKSKRAEWFTNHFDKGIFLSDAETAYKEWLKKQ